MARKVVGRRRPRRRPLGSNKTTGGGAREHRPVQRRLALVFVLSAADALVSAFLPRRTSPCRVHRRLPPRHPGPPRGRRLRRLRPPPERRMRRRRPPRRRTRVPPRIRRRRAKRHGHRRRSPRRREVRRRRGSRLLPRARRANPPRPLDVPWRDRTCPSRPTATRRARGSPSRRHLADAADQVSDAAATFRVSSEDALSSATRALRLRAAYDVSYARNKTDVLTLAPIRIHTNVTAEVEALAARASAGFAALEAETASALAASASVAATRSLGSRRRRRRLRGIRRRRPRVRDGGDDQTVERGRVVRRVRARGGWAVDAIAAVAGDVPTWRCRRPRDTARRRSRRRDRDGRHLARERRLGCVRGAPRGGVPRGGRRAGRDGARGVSRSGGGGGGGEPRALPAVFDDYDPPPRREGGESGAEASLEEASAIEERARVSAATRAAVSRTEPPPSRVSSNRNAPPRSPRRIAASTRDTTRIRRRVRRRRRRRSRRRRRKDPPGGRVGRRERRRGVARRDPSGRGRVDRRRVVPPSGGGRARRRRPRVSFRAFRSRRRDAPLPGRAAPPAHRSHRQSPAVVPGRARVRNGDRERTSPGDGAGRRGARPSGDARRGSRRRRRARRDARRVRVRPTHEAHAAGCARGCDGTFVTRNAHSLAHNYAAARGSRAVAVAATRTETARRDACAARPPRRRASRRSAREPSRGASARGRARYDASRTARCVDVDAYRAGRNETMRATPSSPSTTRTTTSGLRACHRTREPSRRDGDGGRDARIPNSHHRRRGGVRVRGVTRVRVDVRGSVAPNLSAVGARGGMFGGGTRARRGDARRVDSFVFSSQTPRAGRPRASRPSRGVRWRGTRGSGSRERSRRTARPRRQTPAVKVSDASRAKNSDEPRARTNAEDGSPSPSPAARWCRGWSRSRGRDVPRSRPTRSAPSRASPASRRDATSDERRATSEAPRIRRAISSDYESNVSSRARSIF